MTKQQTLLLLLLIFTATCLRAQKKELTQARSYIKSGKDYDKAEQLMTGLLKDSANRNNDRIYLTWYEAVEGQYAAANEKIYLKQKYDTAALFSLVRRMYIITETLDSIDARPDERGRVRMQYRKKHAAEMDRLRRNLFYGGTYHLRRNNYLTAFEFFDTYIDAARQPLFTGYDYMKNDSLMNEAAYWAVVCGHKAQKPEVTLKYSELALTNKSKVVYTLQYMCEAYNRMSDIESYKQTLIEGFNRFPEYPYFFPRLADLYTSRHEEDSVLLIADQGLQKFPDKPIFMLAKSLALLHLERYDECVAVSEQLVKVDPKMPEPYFNIATSYLNQALELEKKNEPRLYRQQLTDLYSKARPNMETYRQLMPNNQNSWAPALYRIYRSLNIGDKFEEIDRLMKQM